MATKKTRKNSVKPSVETAAQAGARAIAEYNFKRAKEEHETARVNLEKASERLAKASGSMAIIAPQNRYNKGAEVFVHQDGFILMATVLSIQVCPDGTDARYIVATDGLNCYRECDLFTSFTLASKVADARLKERMKKHESRTK